jgi:hypothetical protein
MSITRRLVVLAVVVVAATASLGLARSAQATINPGTPAQAPVQLSTMAAHDDAIQDCRANGGTWTEGPDPDNPGGRVGQCTWDQCKLKWFRVGSIAVPYKSCVTMRSPVYMWGG